VVTASLTSSSWNRQQERISNGGTDDNYYMWKIRIVRRMIELFPFESREEMLRQQSVSGYCYESTHAGKYTTSLILDRTTQFLKRFAIIDTCVNCRASRSTIKARSLQVKSFFCPKTLCI